MAATTEDACVVLSTVGSADEARAVAGAVLRARLAACVQILPAASHYWWDGEIQEGAEHLMIFKARDGDYPALEAMIRAHHSYDVPEILKLAVAGGSGDYLSWLFRETARGGPDRNG